MQPATRAILDYNAGRDPERLRRKLALIAADPFAFMRGTCHLFYAGLSALPAAPALRAARVDLRRFGSGKRANAIL